MAQYRRAERVAEVIREKISGIILRLGDERFGFLTITDVWVSDDLQQARIYYSVIGGEEQKISAGQSLKQALPFMRREIGASLGLRYTPQLSFFYDQTPRKAARVLELLEQIKTENKIKPEKKPKKSSKK